jgi:hypothetical protein
MGDPGKQIARIWPIVFLSSINPAIARDCAICG